MTMFILITLLAYAVAEPPVGDGYASRRSGHDHHGFENQRSLSQEYGAPALGARSSYASNEARSFSYDQSRSAPSQEYGPPEFRSISQNYGLPNSRKALSQDYKSPNNVRSSFTQEYRSSNARTGLSQEYGTPNTRTGLSQQYGAPNARSGISQEYGLPNARSNLNQEYGQPNSRSLSQQYGPPNQRNAGADYGRSQDYSISTARLSQDYGVPQLRGGSNIPSDSYGQPLLRSSQTLADYSTPSEEYGAPSQRNLDQAPSQKYGQPNFRNSQSYSPSQSQSLSRFNKGSASTRSFQSSFGSRSPSQTYGTPRSSYSVSSARNIDSYSPASKSISATYLPSPKGVSQSYGAPDGRSLFTEYDAPDARGFHTNAYASSFESARSAPSTKHGAPSVRDAMPSEQYGVPEQYDALSSQGYSYARNALDELLNQEPANYDFGYKVSDYSSGSDFGHTESRQENKAEGSYFVVLPDGTKQVVEYEADERGFKPRISVESAESRLGYDDNAADIARAADGPY
ncbi:pro-resilin-like [Bicyclus anynana]|uniref:Pro-resilin-like n=1 Tax=Bicyclus anynana TaxID=110368 RepID=A0A6J1NZM8_BICAN|nr:pro-resilin-like [Bicyclus anynana]